MGCSAEQLMPLPITVYMTATSYRRESRHLICQQCLNSTFNQVCEGRSGYERLISRGRSDFEYSSDSSWDVCWTSPRNVLVCYRWDVSFRRSNVRHSLRPSLLLHFLLLILPYMSSQAKKRQVINIDGMSVQTCICLLGIYLFSDMQSSELKVNWLNAFCAFLVLTCQDGLRRKICVNTPRVLNM